MNDINITEDFPAELAQLENMINFVKKPIIENGFDKKFIYNINLAMEEILVNVISYAYPVDTGDLSIELNIEKDQKVTIIVKDSGKEFNPLDKQKPDLNIPLEERPIGGLGIFIVRKIMDKVNYTRSNDKNILKMTINREE